MRIPTATLQASDSTGFQGPDTVVNNHEIVLHTKFFVCAQMNFIGLEIL
jgi:hypothetical protein